MNGGSACGAAGNRFGDIAIKSGDHREVGKRRLVQEIALARWYSWVDSNHRPPDPQFRCPGLIEFPAHFLEYINRLFPGAFATNELYDDCLELLCGGSSVVPWLKIRLAQCAIVGSPSG
jgi:hypothetical protein